MFSLRPGCGPRHAAPGDGKDSESQEKAWLRRGRDGRRLSWGRRDPPWSENYAAHIAGCGQGGGRRDSGCPRGSAPSGGSGRSHLWAPGRTPSCWQGGEGMGPQTQGDSDVGVPGEGAGLWARVPPSPEAPGSPRAALRPPSVPWEARAETRDSRASVHTAVGPRPLPSALLPPPPRLPWGRPTRPVVLCAPGRAAPRLTHLGSSSEPREGRRLEGPCCFRFEGAPSPPHSCLDPAFWETLWQFPLTSVNPESVAHRGRPTSASDLRLPAQHIPPPRGLAEHPALDSPPSRRFRGPSAHNPPAAPGPRLRPLEVRWLGHRGLCLLGH